MNTIQRTPRIAGLLYLVLAALSAFGLVYVPSVLLAPGGGAATVSNILANEWLFRLGIVSNLLAFTLNIFVAVFLYELLKPVNKSMASLMVILILMGLAIAMLNELNQVAALLLVSGARYLAAFTADQLQALVPLFLDLYEYGFLISHIFFGLWLFPMGYLIFKSGSGSEALFRDGKSYTVRAGDIILVDYAALYKFSIPERVEIIAFLLPKGMSPVIDENVNFLIIPGIAATSPTDRVHKRWWKRDTSESGPV